METRKSEPVEYSLAVAILDGMIADAKANMVLFSGKKKLRMFERKYLRESRAFLTNSTGALEFLLSGVEGIELEPALEYLKNFALWGYKAEQAKRTLREYRAEQAKRNRQTEESVPKSMLG